MRRNKKALSSGGLYGEMEGNGRGKD